MQRKTRSEAIESNIIHDEDHQRNRRRLDGLYGRVAHAQDIWILAHCRGRSVLDVGAGYGNLTRCALDQGMEVTGIEIDDEKIDLARQWFDVELHPRDIHDGGFGVGEFDTVVFREVVRHLQLPQAMTQVSKAASQRVIVFQANSILPLRLANRIFGHREHAEYTTGDIVAALTEAGFTCRKVLYRDTLAFPLSGGYIGRPLLPGWKWVGVLALACDHCLTAIFRTLGIARWTCFRKMVIADKSGAEDVAQ